jgi:hypothetical protein
VIEWNRAYSRIAGSQAFALLFGRSYPKDAFRPYSFATIFDSLPPANLGASSAPNTGVYATTRANLSAPTSTDVIVPGLPQNRQILFPAGAVILGITAAATLGQRAYTGTDFNYAPTMSTGKRDLFTLDLDYTSGDSIVAGNPISELVSNPNSSIIAAPPISAEALLGGAGISHIFPDRELWVAPGLGITMTARSLVLPSNTDSTSSAPPNLSLHLVFHAMVPGTVRASS